MEKISVSTTAQELLGIINWVKKHTTADTVEGDVSKNLAKTTKASLCYYLRVLTDALEKQHSTQTDHAKPAKQQKKSLKTLKRKLERKNKALTELTADLAQANSNLHELQKKLKTIHVEKHQLQNNLQEKTSLLEKMSLKSMESVLSILPDWMTSGTNWKSEYSALNNEHKVLSDKLTEVQNDLSQSLQINEQTRQQNKHSEAQFEATIEQLSTANDRLIAQAAQRPDKLGEHLGDYEKRENYQVVKEYQEFCLRQGMDYLAEEMGQLIHAPDESIDELQRHYQLLDMKALLLKHLVIKPYDIQVRKLRTTRKLMSFAVFRKNHLNALMSELDLPSKIKQPFLQIAEKSFSLVNELISLKPPCQLLLVAPGVPFSAAEHELDSMCKQAGERVKFTVVPGIFSGHEILMKAVVLTE